MIWEISVAIIALAFVVLVFFLIKTLNTLQQSLKEINHTMNDLQKDLNVISFEVKGLIINTNQITLDLQTKMKSLDSLFGTVENVGDTLEVVTSSLRSASNRYLTNANQRNTAEIASGNKIYKVINAATSLYDIWQQVKVNRANKNRKSSR